MTQEQYIAILFDDCGFDGPARRAWLEAEYKVRYADELTTHGKHQVIDRLKALKESAREAAAPARDAGSGLLFE